MKALPLAPKEVQKLPRAYLANVIYTLVGKPFADWVTRGIEARNAKMKLKNDLLVEMDPEIARIFQTSSSVSGKFFIYMTILSIIL